MKSTELKNTARNISLVVFPALALSLGAYAQRAEFLQSSVVPAANGYVEVKPEHYTTYLIKVQVADLVAAKKLIPAKHIYVVWMITEQTITKNLGQINGLSGLFVKKLKTSLETVSTFRPVKVFITTEYDARVQYPSSQVILTTQII